MPQYPVPWLALLLFTQFFVINFFVAAKSALAASCNLCVQQRLAGYSFLTRLRTVSQTSGNRGAGGAMGSLFAPGPLRRHGVIATHAAAALAQAVGLQPGCKQSVVKKTASISLSSRPKTIPALGSPSVFSPKRLAGRFKTGALTTPTPRAAALAAGSTQTSSTARATR